MEGLLFVLAFVIVAVVVWYFFDDDMDAIRTSRKETEREKIARGEMEKPATLGQIAGFSLLLIAMFAFIGWLIVA